MLRRCLIGLAATLLVATEPAHARDETDTALTALEITAVCDLFRAISKGVDFAPDYSDNDEAPRPKSLIKPLTWKPAPRSIRCAGRRQNLRRLGHDRIERLGISEDSMVVAVSSANSLVGHTSSFIKRDNIWLLAETRMDWEF